MANLTFPHLAALNMDVANRLSEQINQLMKQPGRIDRKLKAAIDLYKKRILELKSIVRSLNFFKLYLFRHCWKIIVGWLKFIMIPLI